MIDPADMCSALDRAKRLRNISIPQSERVFKVLCPSTAQESATCMPAVRYESFQRRQSISQMYRQYGPKHLLILPGERWFQNYRDPLFALPACNISMVLSSRGGNSAVLIQPCSSTSTKWMHLYRCLIMK